MADPPGSPEAASEVLLRQRLKETEQRLVLSQELNGLLQSKLSEMEAQLRNRSSQLLRAIRLAEMTQSESDVLGIDAEMRRLASQRVAASSEARRMPRIDPQRLASLANLTSSSGGGSGGNGRGTHPDAEACIEGLPESFALYLESIAPRFKDVAVQSLLPTAVEQELLRAVDEARAELSRRIEQSAAQEQQLAVLQCKVDVKEEVIAMLQHDRDRSTREALGSMSARLDDRQVFERRMLMMQNHVESASSGVAFIRNRLALARQYARELHAAEVLLRTRLGPDDFELRDRLGLSMEKLRTTLEKMDELTTPQSPDNPQMVMAVSTMDTR